MARLSYIYYINLRRSLAHIAFIPVTCFTDRINWCKKKGKKREKRLKHSIAFYGCIDASINACKDYHRVSIPVSSFCEI